jgi:hypothetical protein
MDNLNLIQFQNQISPLQELWMNNIVGDDAWDVISTNLYIWRWGSENSKKDLLKVLIVTWNGKIVTVQALQHQEIFFSIMIHMDLKTLMGFLYSNCVNHDNLKMYLLIYNSKYGIHDKFGGNLNLYFDWVM